MLQNGEANERPKNTPSKHTLKNIYDELPRLTPMWIRQELRWYGYNVFPAEIDLMLEGYEAVPPDIEAALRRVAAEHIEQGPVVQEQVDQVLEEYLCSDDD